MNKQVYLDAQFERLTQNVDLLELLDFAARLEQHCRTHLVTVPVCVEVFSTNHYSTVHVDLFTGTKLEEALSFLKDKPIKETHFWVWEFNAIDASSIPQRRTLIQRDTLCSPGHYYHIDVDLG